MRISSAQIYSLGIKAITERQSELARTQAELSSGQRVNKPSDDPAAMARILDIKAGMDRIDQYSRNSEFATNSLALEETALAQVNTDLQRVRELMLQANNSSNSASDRQSIANEINQQLQGIKSLANSRDAAGNYIFAGTRSDTVPFSEVNGTVTYAGDGGSKSLQISAQASLQIGDSGADVFLRIRNGDGRVGVTADNTNTGSAVLGSFSADSTVTDSYTLQFAAGVNPGEFVYEVRDSGSTLVSSGNYTDGSSIQFAGVSLQISGTPQVGDSFSISPAQNQSVFATLENVVSVLESADGSVANTTAIHNELARSLADIDQAMTHISAKRASVGSRLSALESVESLNQDLKLHLQTVKSQTSDLDYVSAISRFNQQLTSLEAAQQAFSRASQLSLFNYL
ncbi:MAG: flagellar hook-associated protein FlgL [Gammaproteobacteria bacterium]